MLRQRLDPTDDGRLPDHWRQKVQDWQNRDYPLLLQVHQGLFETLGIMDWQRFSEIMRLLIDNPDFVREVMAIQAAFACQLTERILQDVPVDAVIFSEPIADNNNPLISPRMFEELALTSYTPILDLVRRYGVETIIFRTYANTRLLIPSIVKWGFNCLWACEVNTTAMDYRALRREFGRDLRLIGGIDTDV
ncbi:MAG: uroporphyrinogen decarboxylase family protein, partial [Anaerolineae bacterium]